MGTLKCRFCGGVNRFPAPPSQAPEKDAALVEQIASAGQVIGVILSDTKHAAQAAVDDEDEGGE
jgi:hypothetical protein